MELISLNTWGGRAGAPLLKRFFEKYQNADIFCLQEVWQTSDLSLIEAWDQRFVTELLALITSWLPEFKCYFRPQYRNIYGLATFVRQSISVESEGDLFVFKENGFENPDAVGNHARNIQFLKLRAGQSLFSIINFHGLWNGEGKNDSKDRILQSEKIVDFVQRLEHPHLLVGDFNLNPDTESFKILQRAIPRNLISEFDIKSTRSSLYPKDGKFADYVLASEGIEINGFEVLPDEVSDHLALRVLFR